VGCKMKDSLSQGSLKVSRSLSRNPMVPMENSHTDA
jgi:hypothetical protein